MYITGWTTIASTPPASTTTGRFLSLADAEDADVGLRDDCAAEQVALQPGLLTGEARAGEVVGGELAVPRLGRGVVDRERHAAHVEAIGALDHGDDQAILGVHGDADVDVAQQHVGVVEHPRVERRVLLERQRGRVGDEREVGEADALLLVAILVGVSRSLEVACMSTSATVTTCGATFFE